MKSIYKIIMGCISIILGIIFNFLLFTESGQDMFLNIQRILETTYFDNGFILLAIIGIIGVLLAIYPIVRYKEMGMSIILSIIGLVLNLIPLAYLLLLFSAF